MYINIIPKFGDCVDGKGWSVGTEIEFEHGGPEVAVEIEAEEGGEYETDFSLSRSAWSPRPPSLFLAAGARLFRSQKSIGFSTLGVRSVALLQVASFAGNMLPKSLKTHKIALNQQKITKTLA